MTETNPNNESGGETPHDSSESSGLPDVLAIGCGCLVAILFLAAVVWVGIVRG